MVLQILLSRKCVQHLRKQTLSSKCISIKPSRSTVPLMLQFFLTQRANEGHLKGNRRVLGHSRHSGNQALQALKHLSTGTLKSLDRLEQSDFNGQLIGGKMGIRLEKPAPNSFKSYRWQNEKPRGGVLK